MENGKKEKKSILNIAICIVLFFVFAYASMFPGYQSPVYWICFPAVAAFLMTGPLSYVMLTQKKIGFTALLPLIFFVIARLIGELKLPECWIPFICIIVIGEVVRNLVGLEKINSVRIACPITMCSIVCWNNGFYFGGDEYINLAIADMGEAYTMTAKNMATPLTYILLLIGVVLLSYISERLTEKIIKCK